MNTATERLTPPAVAPANPWWRGATIYQIYPRSFLDTNGDGVGDLPGIIERLDYVATLGVEAIWVSPFFQSPMADFGYDIADYRAVDSIFGTLADFDRLVAKAHRLGLKVIIDQVLSHSSSQHAWFEESRQSRTNPKADWYVWADAREDGTPPNNWLSIFGGVAWTWEPRRGQYYLHNFLSEQPDLNFHNPEVRRRRSTTCASGWIAASTACGSTPSTSASTTQLRDNPPRPKHRARRAASSRESLRLPMAPLQQHAAGDAAVPREHPRLLMNSRTSWRSARSPPTIPPPRCRIHAAGPAAHGVQLRAAEQRQLAAHIRARSKTSCGARRRAGRAGRSPTTTSSAWSAAGAAAHRCRTRRRS
jgi:alpha-glucosidase